MPADRGGGHEGVGVCPDFVEGDAFVGSDGVVEGVEDEGGRAHVEKFVDRGGVAVVCADGGVAKDFGS